MSRSRLSIFQLYVGAVTLAGLGVLAVAVGTTGVTQLPGPRPGQFWLFSAFLLAAELRPLAWLRRKGGGEITASWTFGLALVLIAPAAGALAAMAVACTLSDLAHRKPLQRTLFNTGQVTLSLAAGAAVLGITGSGHALLRPSGATFSWLAATALAGVTLFILNGILTCVVLALHQDVPVWPVVRGGVATNVSTDGMLLALAPIFVVVADVSLLLLPLLLVTATAVYSSAKLALTREHEATHDALTNLPNRRHFFDAVGDALSTARRREQQMAIVLVDLDGFKEINDRFGHDVGDHVLQEVSARLDRETRAGDVVARLGGDEFALLLRHLGSVDSAERAATSLLERLRQPVFVRDLPIAVGGSFGVAMFPAHGEDVDTLMNHADLAMYMAKNRGLGVQLFDSEEQAPGHGRLTLLSELRVALEREELVLHYQPLVDLATGEAKGVEALVRWQHATHGLVPPGEFMPLAEHTELMGPLTELVLRKALIQAADWREAGHPLEMSVNASVRNLHDLRFPDVVARLLDETGVPPETLELEITENTVMSDPKRTAVVLDRLKEMGIRLAIDDFGTGYSSLANLRDLPVDRIKIDRSFVQRMLTCPSDALIVESVIRLSQGLGLTTVAEGVEDEAVLARLHDMGADVAQGFYFSRPAPGPQCLHRIELIPHLAGLPRRPVQLRAVAG